MQMNDMHLAGLQAEIFEKACQNVFTSVCCCFAFLQFHRQLKSYNFDNSQEEVLVQLRRNTYPPLSLSYCPTEQMALFYYDNDGGTFELYSVPKNGTNADDVKKGFYTAAVFFSRSKFAVLDKTRQVHQPVDMHRLLSPFSLSDEPAAK